jgi:hypothetical protein
MVYSRIASHVDYNEEDSICSEDVGHESNLYVSKLFEQDIIFTLGKVKFTHIDNGVIFFPIYLVSDKFEIVEKIGIYEMTKDEFLENIDQMKNEIDLSLLHEPIIFKNTEKTLRKLGCYSSHKVVAHKNITRTKKSQYDKNGKYDKNNKNDDKKNGNNKDENNDENIIHDVVGDVNYEITDLDFSNINRNIEISLKDGIFVKHDRERMSLLPDELKETAEQITKSYRTSANDNWLKRMMKNPHYEFKDVHDDNNSFYAVIRDAFEQIGYYTTIQKLRNIVAKHTTKKHLIANRILFSEYNSQISNLRIRMIEIRRIIEVDFRKKIKNSVLTRVEQKDIINKCAILKDEFDTMNKLKKNIIKIIDDTFGKDFELVGNLEKYKERIVSNNCCINSNAISIIERELNIKTIIFSEIDCNDQNEVIKSEKYIDGKILYKPDYYILISVRNGYYKSVSYKNKKILEFPEIPYNVKMIIIKKNMAGISGKYASIEGRDGNERYCL